MAISLTSLRTTTALSAPRLLVYGVAGVGKTTFAAGSDSAVFVLCEDGLGTLQVPHFPLARTFDEVTGALDALLVEEHAFRTAIVDSVDWLEPLIWAETARRNKWASIEAPGYGKGYAEALGVWREYLERLNALRNQKGMAIVQIAHADIRRFDSPESEPFDRYGLKLHARAAALLLEHSDAVLFANYKTYIAKADVGFNKKVTRGIGTGERVLFAAERPAFIAKNRYGLPDELPLDWPAFVAALPSPNPEKTKEAK